MKKVLSICLSMVTAVAIAGCAATPPTTTSSSKAASVASSAVPSGEKVTVEFFQMKDEGTDYYTDLIARFEAANPDIKIEHTNVPDAETVLMTRMASDQVPDVFTHFPLDASFREQVKAGYVMDITGNPALSNVADDILKISLIEGKSYSVPVSLNMLGIYYNTEIFTANNLSVPKTIDELYAICEKLKAAGITPFTFPDKDVWTVRQFCDRASVTMLKDPVGLFEEIASGKTTAMDSAEMRKMAETIVKLRSYGQEDNLGTGYEQSIADFANSKAAMFFSGTFAYPEIVKNNSAIKFEMFRYPSFGAGDTDRVGVNIDTAFCISATTEKAEAAKKFVEFCTTAENAQVFSDYDGTPSSIKNVKFNKAEFDKMFTEYVQTGKTMSVPSNSWPAAFGGEYGNINQELIDSGNVDNWLKSVNQLILDTYNE